MLCVRRRRQRSAGIDSPSSKRGRYGRYGRLTFSYTSSREARNARSHTRSAREHNGGHAVTDGDHSSVVTSNLLRSDTVWTHTPWSAGKGGGGRKSESESDESDGGGYKGTGANGDRCAEGCSSGMSSLSARSRFSGCSGAGGAEPLPLSFSVARTRLLCCFADQYSACSAQTRLGRSLACCRRRSGRQREHRRRGDDSSHLNTGHDRRRGRRGRRGHRRRDRDRDRDRDQIDRAFADSDHSPGRRGDASPQYGGQEWKEEHGGGDSDGGGARRVRSMGMRGAAASSSVTPASTIVPFGHELAVVRSREAVRSRNYNHVHQ